MSLIDPRNAPILEYPEDHPSKRYVMTRFRFLEDYNGLHIPWEQRGGFSYDFEWYCPEDDRNWRISEFLYCYVWTHSVQDNWLTNPANATEYEVLSLKQIKEARAIRDYWEAAAENEPLALEIAIRTAELLDTWDTSIRLRLEQVGLDADALVE